MTKKKTKKPRQSRLQTMEDPTADALLADGEEYLSVLRQRMKLQQRENTLGDELCTKLRDHGLSKLTLDDGTVLRYVHMEKDKLRVVSGRSQDDGDGE